MSLHLLHHISKTLNYSMVGIIICVGLCGCEETIVPEPPRPVIEAWIDSDGYPVVIFTESMVPGESNTSFNNKIIRWGRVTISDGVSSVILTGGSDRNLIPPYKYYTFDMKGTPGRTYTLTAEYDGMYASATCTMPEPTPIDRVNITPIEGNDTLRSATLHFTSPSDTPAYYLVTVRYEDNPARPLPAMMGTLEAVEPGCHYSIPLYNAPSGFTDDPFVPQLIVGNRYIFSLCRVTKEVYNYWTTFSNTTMFGGNTFTSSSTTPQGNILGGYGIFSAQGSQHTTIDI